MFKKREKRIPEPLPVKKIEISTKHEKARWILVAVLLTIGIVSIGFGIYYALNIQPGWEEVKVNTKEVNCGEDFKLMYDFSDAGGNAANVNKAVIKCYSNAAVEAFQLFSNDVSKPGLGNLAQVNANVNQPVAVDEDLYYALRLVAESGTRHVFMAPIAAQYENVFVCDSEVEAALYDPANDPALRQWMAEAAVFAQDPAHIRLDILPENQVCLIVSEEYVAYAQEHDISEFMDFGWMRNAFVADFLAEKLQEAGFTQCYLTSFDGFTRNLATGGDFSFNIFDRQDMDIYTPAAMQYSGPTSIVFVRDYALTDMDRWSYYSFSTGRVITPYFDPVDGMCRSGVHNLVSYSSERSCAQIALAVADIYVGENFDSRKLDALRSSHIYSIWPEGTQLCYNDLQLTLNPAQGNLKHTFALKE